MTKRLSEIKFFINQLKISDPGWPLELSNVKCSRCRQQVLRVEYNQKTALICVNGGCSNHHGYWDIKSIIEKIGVVA